MSEENHEDEKNMKPVGYVSEQYACHTVLFMFPTAKVNRKM